VLFSLFAGGLCLPCVFSYVCRGSRICQTLCRKSSANSMFAVCPFFSSRHTY
jgi:hypothetical protein